MFFSKLLYNFFIQLYKVGISITALWSEKSVLWLKGRKNWKEKLNQFAALKKKLIWIHCSSLGEFEQAIPIIKNLKQYFTDYKIIVSFFSPSGYEIHKSNPLIDFVCYLPMDSTKNASDFLDILKPKLIIFIKYEFWFYYLSESKKRDIPVLLVSGIFRANQTFFKWYGSLHRNMLNCFEYFFLQDENSARLLKSIGFNNHQVNGDTRFERVIEIAQSNTEVSEINSFIENGFCIVAGSTWKLDDEILSKFLSTNPSVKAIVAPHNIDEKSIQHCSQTYTNSILFSEIKNSNFNLIQTIIINKIGLLSSLYRYADVCFIGGGFDKSNGVHNTIEAAVYAKPLIFGPYYSKYKEAVDLVNLKSAFSTHNYEEFEQKINHFKNDISLKKNTGEIAGNYVYKSTGATNKIIYYIQENRLLTR